MNIVNIMNFIKVKVNNNIYKKEAIDLHQSKNIII